MRDAKLVTTEKVNREVRDLMSQSQSLHLATLDSLGQSYASYAAFAYSEAGIYLLISEVAQHAVYLRNCPTASIMIIEDEGTAAELFARKRIAMQVDAEYLDTQDPDYGGALEVMSERLGERIGMLANLSDFKLFRLLPKQGRYVRGLGQAYHLEFSNLFDVSVKHLTGGHRERA